MTPVVSFLASCAQNPAAHFLTFPPDYPQAMRTALVLDLIPYAITIVTDN